jgi:fucose 4-O-acetylase-like acetyltransferase
MRSRGIARAVRPTRDPFFDNAKFLLIVLVVVGHNWYPAIDDLRVVKAAYLVVYTVHIPAFVLLSGYFSRGFEGRRRQWRKLVTGVLLPYLIFETAYAAEAAALSGHGFSLHLSSPIYVCWFLLALFVWRASTPLWRSLPHPVLLSVAVSLVAGVAVVSTDFGLSRALQLMPWFVLGLQLHRRHFDVLHRRWARVAGAAVVVVAAVVAYLVAPGVDARWLDREWDAHTLGVPAAAGLAIALGLTVVTAPMIAAVLALVPRNRSLLTRLGALTMYPFLLHGLVVRVAQHVGVHRALIGWGLGGVALLTLGAVLLTVLLALPVVRRLTWWAVEPGRLRLPGGRARATAPEGEAPATPAPEAGAGVPPERAQAGPPPISGRG